MFIAVQGKARERGCCRFSGFTATAYPLRVQRGMVIPFRGGATPPCAAKDMQYTS